MTVLVLKNVVTAINSHVNAGINGTHLDLFGLHPQRATALIDVTANDIVSTSALTVLFNLDDRLQVKIFRLDQVRSSLADTRSRLTQTLTRRRKIQRSLRTTSARQRQTLTQLQRVGRSLSRTITRRRRARTRLRHAHSRLATISRRTHALRRSATILQARHSHLLRRRTIVHSRVTTHSRVVTSHSHTVTRLSRSLSSLSSTVTSHSHTVSRQRRQLSALRVRRSLLRRRITSLRIRCQKVFLNGVTLAHGRRVVSNIFRINSHRRTTTLVGRFITRTGHQIVRTVTPKSAPRRPIITLSQSSISQLVSQLKANSRFIIHLLSTTGCVANRPYIIHGRRPYVRMFLSIAPGGLICRRKRELTAMSIRQRPVDSHSLIRHLGLLLISTRFHTHRRKLISSSLRVTSGHARALLRFLSTIERRNRTLSLRTVTTRSLFGTNPLRVRLITSHGNHVLFDASSFINPGNEPSDP